MFFLVTIGTNSLRPNTSEISTGQVMELLPPKSVFPNEKRVFARTSNSSNLLNGVQGVAGSNPAVPILPPARGAGANRSAALSPTPLALLAAYGQIRSDFVPAIPATNRSAALSPTPLALLVSFRLHRAGCSPVLY